jgi:hypothetical protein
VHLVAVDPGDEGVLSDRRRPLLAGRRLLRGADVRHGCATAPAEHRVDHLQAEVGLVQLRDGVVASLAAGQALLGLGPVG